MARTRLKTIGVPRTNQKRDTPSTVSYTHLLRIIHFHRNDISAMGLELWGDIIAEWGIAIRTSTHENTVDKDRCVHIRTIKIYIYTVTRFEIGRRFKMFAVPSHSTGQRATTRARRVILTKLALDGPVVGQVERSPSGIVHVWRGQIGCVGSCL